MKRINQLIVLLPFMSPAVHGAMILNPTQSVMTSGFFQGADQVRGYAGDNRPVFRVSPDGTFGVAQGEVIYLDFSNFDPGSLTGPITQAVLSLTSVSGGFGGDASPTNRLELSASGVTADPFTEIADSSSPGAIDALTFSNDFLLPATDSVLVDSFGIVELDITDLVRDWADGTTSNFVVALTGADLDGGIDILHGFQNDTETPGSTTLSVIPEPGSNLLGAFGLMMVILKRRR